MAKPVRLELDAKTGRAPICGRIGVAVRELRLALGMTQEELAGRARLALRTIRNLESGATAASVDNLARIAMVFGLGFYELGYVVEWVWASADEQSAFAMRGKILP